MWPFSRRREAARTERRDGFGFGSDLGWYGSYGATSYAPVNAVLAENIAAMSAAIQLISGTLASLPASVVRKENGGRVALPSHPVAKLTVQPNWRQSWFDWLLMTMSDCLRYGNALSVIETDGRGVVTGLSPIPWPAVRPLVLPSGRMAFDIVASWGWFTATPGVLRRYLDTEVFLLRDRSDDGFIGRSRISRAPIGDRGRKRVEQLCHEHVAERHRTKLGAVASEGAER
jgi:phage portal protein BeeE